MRPTDDDDRGPAHDVERPPYLVGGRIDEWAPEVHDVGLVTPPGVDVETWHVEQRWVQRDVAARINKREVAMIWEAANGADDVDAGRLERAREWLREAAKQPGAPDRLVRAARDLTTDD